MEIKSENIIKGRVAENLVQELLKRSGNKVYPLGTEILKSFEFYGEYLPQNSELRRRVASIPDFLVISKNKKPLLVEVKFRTDPEALEEELLLEKEILENFWKSRIILVTPKEPYFRLLIPPYFEKSKKEGWPVPVFRWIRIEKDALMNVKTEILKEFSELVKKYYS